MAEKKAAPAAVNDVNVFDLEGRAVRFSDLWKDRKVLLVFVRHFG
jgi:hypothetical protein